MNTKAPTVVEAATVLVRDVTACAKLLVKSYQQADLYLKTMPRFQDDGDVDWRWDEAHQQRSRRHKELLTLVPVTRRLKAHLNQVREGKCEFDEMLFAQLLAVLICEFAMHPDPLHDAFGFWKLPVSTGLVAGQWWGICKEADRSFPTFRETSRSLSDVRHNTLGELRDRYRRNEQERKYLSKGKDALVKDFMVLSQRLYQTLTVEEFALLKECGELFDWHARCGYFS